jgi:FkbM family methyltransferase
MTLFLPFGKIFDIKTIKFLGYELEGFDFKTLQFLFGEVFVRNEYFFQTDIKNPTIIDCGAEIGFTMTYFKHLYPHSHITVFEPDIESYKLLQKNIKVNGFTHITTYNKAISSRAGPTKFYMGNGKGDLRKSLISDRSGQNERLVYTIRLADFLVSKKVSYLKMDIEGYETVVMPDLSKSGVLKNVDQMGIEYHHHILESDKSLFSQFLSCVENNGFSYQLETRGIPLKNSFQDILVLAYRRKR